MCVHDVLVRMVANETLTRAGYEVVLAEGGNEAIASLEGQRFDLVITDIIMPDVDGLELTREVRRRWPLTPIIAISSGGRLDSGFYLPMANALGATAVMAKPLRPGPFLLAVQDVLDRAQRRIA